MGSIQAMGRSDHRAQHAPHLAHRGARPRAHPRGRTVRRQRRESRDHPRRYGWICSEISEVEVYTGGDMRNRHLQVLDHEPEVLVDVGFELVDTLLEKRREQAASVRGAIEVTRSGITRLRRAADIPFPVVNINDGRLKDAVENRHGVGQAVWQALSTLTGMHLAGRRAAVVGYGPVGRGLANGTAEQPASRSRWWRPTRYADCSRTTTAFPPPS